MSVWADLTGTVTTRKVSRSGGPIHLVGLPAMDPGDAGLIVLASTNSIATPTEQRGNWPTLSTRDNGTTFRGTVLRRTWTGLPYSAVPFSQEDDGLPNVLIKLGSSITNGTLSAIALAVAGSKWDMATPAVASAEGVSATPDPPALTLADSRPRLWIAAATYVGSQVPSAAPSGYGDLTSQTASRSAMVAWRVLNAASENPFPFTLATSTAWVAFTIALSPRDLEGAQTITTDPTAFRRRYWPVPRLIGGKSTQTFEGWALNHLRDRQGALWPLNEPGGSPKFRDVSGNEWHNHQGSGVGASGGHPPIVPGSSYQASARMQDQAGTGASRAPVQNDGTGSRAWGLEPRGACTLWGWLRVEKALGNAYIMVFCGQASPRAGIQTAQNTGLLAWHQRSSVTGTLTLAPSALQLQLNTNYFCVGTREADGKTVTLLLGATGEPTVVSGVLSDVTPTQTETLTLQHPRANGGGSAFGQLYGMVMGVALPFPSLAAGLEAGRGAFVAQPPPPPDDVPPPVPTPTTIYRWRRAITADGKYRWRRAITRTTAEGDPAKRRRVFAHYGGAE